MCRPPERGDLKHNKGEQKKQRAQKARKKEMVSLCGRRERARYSSLLRHFRAAKTSFGSLGTRLLEGTRL